jgi:hypothetical protein
MMAQMPRPTVQASPFKSSRQVQVKSVEGLSFKAYNSFQDKVDALGFKPISKAVQFVPPNTTDFSQMKKPRILAPPSPVIEEEYQTDIPDVDAIEEDAMDGTGMKKLKKGSPAMKAHMARLRAMRKK